MHYIPESNSRKFLASLVVVLSGMSRVEVIEFAAAYLR